MYQGTSPFSQSPHHSPTGQLQEFLQVLPPSGFTSRGLISMHQSFPFVVQLRSFHPSFLSHSEWIRSPYAKLESFPNKSLVPLQPQTLSLLAFLAQPALCAPRCCSSLCVLALVLSVECPSLAPSLHSGFCSSSSFLEGTMFATPLPF
jgi:hypothetical protein